MLAATPPFVTDVAAWCASFLAVIGVFTAVSRIPFVRKTWRRSVSTPYWDAHRTVIVEATEPQFTAIKAELRTNGGSSLRDAVDRVERDLHGFRDDVLERIAEIDARVKALEDGV